VGRTCLQRRHFVLSAHCTSSHAAQRIFVRSSHMDSPLENCGLLFSLCLRQQLKEKSACFRPLHSGSRVHGKCRLDPPIGLAVVLPDIPPIGAARALEFQVKVGQLIDGIGSADLLVGRLPEPRESLFEQLKYRLEKGPRWPILFGHRITSIVSVVDERQIRNSAQAQAKRLSCTGTAAGQGVFLIPVLTGSSRWMPS